MALKPVHAVRPATRSLVFAGLAAPRSSAMTSSLGTAPRRLEALMRCAPLHCSVTTAQRAPSLPGSAVATARVFSARCAEAVQIRRRRAMQSGRVACSAAAGTCAAVSNDNGTPCCAVSFVKATPPGDERQRDVCTTCGFVDYKNPKVVVAAVVVRGSSVLLCKRAVEPSAGKWGFPQGECAAACV